MTTEVKLIRVFTSGSTLKLPSQAACFPVISSMHTQSMQKMSQRLMCLSHICENTGWRRCKYHREIFRQTQGKIKNMPPLLQFIQHAASNSNGTNLLRQRINRLTVSLILKNSHPSALAHIKKNFHTSVSPNKKTKL